MTYQSYFTAIFYLEKLYLGDISNDLVHYITHVKIAVLFLFTVLTINEDAYPNEVKGIVTDIMNGNAFDVNGVGCVRLANIVSFSLGSLQGIRAREFTRDQLMGTQVFWIRTTRLRADLTAAERSWYTRLIPMASKSESQL
ncbi:MAG: hypothetical protein LUQ38_12115 [Methanotrichaceae archaeon]|nr:hypothetical protein [Methanotrichaceae archaeon]